MQPIFVSKPTFARIDYLRQGGRLVDEEGTHNVKFLTKNYTKTILSHTRAWATAQKAPRLQPSCDDFLNTLHRQRHGKHLAYNRQHERLQGMLLMPNEASSMQTQK